MTVELTTTWTTEVAEPGLVNCMCCAVYLVWYQWCVLQMPNFVMLIFLSKSLSISLYLIYGCLVPGLRGLVRSGSRLRYFPCISSAFRSITNPRPKSSRKPEARRCGATPVQRAARLSPTRRLDRRRRVPLRPLRSGLEAPRGWTLSEANTV